MKNLILFFALFSFNPLFSNSIDRIVVAKEIVTLDERYQNVDAVFIKGSRIQAVGTKDELLKEFPID